MKEGSLASPLKIDYNKFYQKSKYISTEVGTNNIAETKNYYSFQLNAPKLILLFKFIEAKKLSYLCIYNFIKKYTILTCLVEKYLLGKILGKGGNGTVFEVIDKRTDKKYAVKLIRKSSVLNNRDYKYIENERKVQLEVQHNNIINLYEVHDCKHYIAFVQKIINSGTLLQFLNEPKKILTENSRLDWIHELSSALFKLHSHGYFHRDIKPGNIMLSKKSELTPDDSYNASDYSLILIDITIDSF